MLAKLYKTTHVAYVGGAFSTGVHNVAEPAVFGNAVLFGPKHINSYEAIQINKLQGGFSVSNQDDCYAVISRLIKDEMFRKQTGKIAQNFILSSKGATQLIVKKIEEFL
jgi:3-deoxy-D-manno-octulosonic-acid transferase